MARKHSFAFFTACLVIVSIASGQDKPDQKVSFSRNVVPIFQANCQGCHQPAKAGGSYVMTSFEKLLAGGESGEAAVVPGKPDESHLIELITQQDGKAVMPRGRKPLASTEIEAIRRWI